MFTRMKIMFPLLAFLLFGLAIRLDADFFATDPGVRGGPPGAGDHIDGISENERKFFWRLSGRSSPSKAARSKAKRRNQALGPGSTWTVAQAAMRNPQSVELARLRILKLTSPTKLAPPTSFRISSSNRGRFGKRDSSSTRTAPATAACMTCSPSPDERMRWDATSPSLTSRPRRQTTT